jgi:hypothetical protein
MSRLPPAFVATWCTPVRSRSMRSIWQSTSNKRRRNSATVWRIIFAKAMIGKTISDISVSGASETAGGKHE